MSKATPRITPDRDSRYMGLAWMHAGFSKDPSTQVGAQIVSEDNFPLGSGYNGPSRRIKDSLVVWDRPSASNPDALSKYDFMKHAESNAIDHCFGASLEGATIYVTALPCPACMYDLIDKGIARIVYYDFQSKKGSSLQNAKWRDKSFELARLAGIKVEEFTGNINWIQDWCARLKELEVFS